MVQLCITRAYRMMYILRLDLNISYCTFDIDIFAPVIRS